MFSFHTHKIWWYSILFRFLLITYDRNPTQSGLTKKQFMKQAHITSKGRLAASTGEARSSDTIVRHKSSLQLQGQHDVVLAEFSISLSNHISKTAASSSSLTSSMPQKGNSFLRATSLNPRIGYNWLSVSTWPSLCEHQWQGEFGAWLPKPDSIAYLVLSPENIAWNTWAYFWGGVVSQGKSGLIGEQGDEKSIELLDKTQDSYLNVSFR